MHKPNQILAVVWDTILHVNWSQKTNNMHMDGQPHVKPTSYCMLFLWTFSNQSPWVTLVPFMSAGALEAASSALSSLLSLLPVISGVFRGGLRWRPRSVPTSWPSLLQSGTALLVALSANARAVLCLGEYAEIKWPQFGIVNLKRGRMSPEVSPEHAECQDEGTRWSLTDRGLKDNTCAFLIDIGCPADR